MNPPAALALFLSRASTTAARDRTSGRRRNRNSKKECMAVPLVLRFINSVRAAHAHLPAQDIRLQKERAVGDDPLPKRESGNDLHCVAHAAAERHRPGDPVPPPLSGEE